MKNSRNKNLSEHLLNVDEDILDKAYEIDDADKLRQYVKSKNAKARKPFYLTPMFRSAAAMVACFVFIIAAVFSFPDLLDPPGFDYVMLENGGNMADNVGGNGTTDVGGNDMVRTVLNGGGYAAPSLPHYFSTEVVKRCLISDNVVSANVYLGHPTFRNSVAFSDFTLDMDELQNCSFFIAINYNGEKSVTVVEAVDYASTSYKVTSTDLYDEGEVYKGTVVNYSKYHKVNLDLSSMVGVPYGYVNIELHIELPDGTQTLVMDDTLYYSVTDTEIVFGLVSNPIAHEGDDGIITHGWTYAG